MGKDPRELYDLKERIGKGSFGEVHRAIDKNTKKEVAIKIIDLEKSDGKRPFFLYSAFKIFIQMISKIFNKR